MSRNGPKRRAARAASIRADSQWAPAGYESFSGTSAAGRQGRKAALGASIGGCCSAKPTAQPPVRANSRELYIEEDPEPRVAHTPHLDRAAAWAAEMASEYPVASPEPRPVTPLALESFGEEGEPLFTYPRGADPQEGTKRCLAAVVIAGVNAGLAALYLGHSSPVYWGLSVTLLLGTIAQVCGCGTCTTSRKSSASRRPDAAVQHRKRAAARPVPGPAATSPLSSQQVQAFADGLTNAEQAENEEEDLLAASLSDDNRCALDQLCQACADILPRGHQSTAADDPPPYLRRVTLSRFLRSRNDDVAKAEAMLRSTVAWRDDPKVWGSSAGNAHDSSMSWLGEAGARLPQPAAAAFAAKHWYGGIHGSDRRGAPVMYTRFGTGDPSRLAALSEAVGEALDGPTVKFDTVLMRQCVAVCEVFEAISPCLASARGEHLDTFIEIIDLGADGEPRWLRRALAAVTHFVGIAKVLDGNYPERVHKVIIVRAPSMFANVWKLVSPLVDEGTQAKISIYAGGSTPDDTPWLDEMRAFIEDDQIPCYLGGACGCADREDGCVDLIPKGNGLEGMTTEDAVAEARRGYGGAGGEVAVCGCERLRLGRDHMLSRWWDTQRG